MAEIAQPNGATENVASRPAFVAPMWHTCLFILILLGLSAVDYVSARHFGASKAASATPPTGAMLITYGGTLIEEWVLFLFVWWGERMRSRTTTVRERIGIRIEKNALARDIGIAAAVWGSAAALNGILHYVLHPAGAELVFKLLPYNVAELLLWTALSVSAGFCEEYIFRGYLQRQFSALTGSLWAGVVIQAALFGLAHGYQGPALMVSIFGLGLIFGIATKWRKSLRPTMIAHAWTDFFSGFAGYIVHALGIAVKFP